MGTGTNGTKIGDECLHMGPPLLLSEVHDSTEADDIVLRKYTMNDLLDLPFLKMLSYKCEDKYYINAEMTEKPHLCPNCGAMHEVFKNLFGSGYAGLGFTVRENSQEKDLRNSHTSSLALFGKREQRIEINSI